MKISIIAAMDKNRGIGFRSRLPWHLHSDLLRFKQITIGHHIVMGRKTYESIGRALEDRINIVITRSDTDAPGCVVLSSLDEAINLAIKNNESELFIIGGGEIFSQAIHLADFLYLTTVETISNSDTYFPYFDVGKWQEVKRESYPSDEKNEFAHMYRILKRK